MSGIVEIRDYTIEPERFAEYRAWAVQHAVPWLAANLDVIDFWMDDGIEAEVTGSNPQVSENGQANVCWIIRWPDKETRDVEFSARMGGDEWKAIWAKHPCPDAYLQMNVRFMRGGS